MTNRNPNDLFVRRFKISPLEEHEDGAFMLYDALSPVLTDYREKHKGWAEHAFRMGQKHQKRCDVANLRKTAARMLHKRFTGHHNARRGPMADALETWLKKAYEMGKADVLNTKNPTG